MRPNGHHDQVVGHPLELGEHVRGQQHRHAVVGRRRQHRRHEIVAGDRVEHCHRLIEHEEARAAGQRQGQRELGLLPAGQLARLALLRDTQLGQPGLGVGLVELPVEIAGEMQHVGGRQVLVQRRVLRDEGDAVECGMRAGAATAENGQLTARGRRQSDREIQQCRLSGTVRTDQRGHVPFGDGQAAVVERFGRTVATCRGRASR